MVSSHFSYTEEYVLDHSPHWLARKYKQAMKEKLEQNRLQALTFSRGIAIVIDALFNKGNGIDEILPPSYEEIAGEAIKSVQSEYVQTVWWKGGGS